MKPHISPIFVSLIKAWFLAQVILLSYSAQYMIILRYDLSFIIYFITLLAYKKSWKKGAKFTARFEIMFTNAWIIPKPFFSTGCNTKPTLAGLDEDDNIGTLHGTKVHFVKVCFMKIYKFSLKKMMQHLENCSFCFYAHGRK